MNSKICKDCKVDKSFSEYRKSTRHLDGLHKVCRDCMCKKEAIRREKTRDHDREVSNARLAKNKENYEKGITVVPEKKVCGACLTEKSSKLFPISKTSIDGLAYCCKECKKLSDQRDYIKHREKRAETTRRYAKAHPELMREIKDRHYQNNKDLVKARAKAWSADKRKNDLDFRLRGGLKTRQRNALKEVDRADEPDVLLGCSATIANWFLEQQFYPKPQTGEAMTWDNYGYMSGEHGWDYEHIIPLSLFDMKIPEHQYQAFHVSNLQPMWYLENYIKHANNVDGLTPGDLRKPLFPGEELKNG